MGDNTKEVLFEAFIQILLHIFEVLLRIFLL
ncbi:hypothetical protein BN1180_05749 [Peribacillus simplex]|uniref:Uncharacterized protein n=1 Tax=Peribacillus simplex TaxID=1478 RepID=A0AAN2PBV5_9BACI|nr:hypothetical protein BN1180_05749 [Peribacillus simplex]